MKHVLILSRISLVIYFCSSNVALSQPVYEAWVARYNGPGNDYDYASAMTVDTSGNVYVTGYSGDLASIDYATIKYDTFGVQRWIARYNGGPGSYDNEATDIAVDMSGNVYVTGHSTGAGTGNDYATIKYDASGVQQWVSRYNGPGNDNDGALAVGVDESGNVYVTGYSGTSAYYDYATIKYNTSGVEQWIARYSGSGNFDYNVAVALAIDGGGNAYVTGSSHSGSDGNYVTIKYDSSGAERWVRTYNRPGRPDFATATSLALDANGSVFVTGYGGNTNQDYVTVKYASSGVELWVARYNGPANMDDDATAIVVDGNGNAYVTGLSHGSGNNGFDYATIKYDASGMEEWVSRYNGPGSYSVDGAKGLAVDEMGNVYVTGYSADNTDFATIKYDISGVEQWVARYNGPSNSGDYASSVVVDGSGNVYVAGQSFGSSTGYDYATIKYTQSPPAGVTLANPLEGSTIISTNDSAECFWHPSGPEVDRYWLEWSGDSVFAFSEIDSVLDDTTGLIGPLESGRTYWWKVRAHNPSGWGEFSDAWSFAVTITSVDAEPEIPAEYSLSQNYPNPFNPNTTIRYGLPEKAYVRLELFNLLGQSVALLVDGGQEAGYHSAKLSASGIASGLYIYRLTAHSPPTGSGQGFVQTKRLILLR